MNHKVKYKISIIDIVSLIIIFLGVGYLTFDYDNYLFLTLVFIWFFVAIINYPAIVKYILLHESMSLSLALWVVFSLILGLLSPDSILDVLKITFAIFITYFPVFLFLLFRRLDLNKNFLSICWGIVIIFQFIAIIYNFYNPGFARKFARGHYEYYNFTIVGGGYPLAYLSVFTGLYLLTNFKRLQLLYSKRIMILEIVLSVSVIYITKSTITLLSFLIGLLVIIILKISKRNLFSIIIIIIILIGTSGVLFVCHYFLESLVEWISSWNNIFGIRLSDLFNQLMSGNLFKFDDTVSARISVYLDSIKYIIKHPLIGNGIFLGFQFSSMKSANMGNHSEWLNNIAAYGIIFGSILFCLFFKLFKQNINENRDYFIYTAVFSIMGLLNLVLVFSSIFSLFFLIPYTEKILQRKEKFRLLSQNI